MSAILTWSLYHLATKTQIDGLSQLQCRLLIRTIDDTQCEQWRVWKQGTADWQSLDHYEEVRNSDGQSLPPPVGGEEPKQERAPRYARTLKIYVDLGGHIFSSKTVDISLTGILIDPPLDVRPEGPFEMQVMNPETGTSVHIICEVVESAEQANRFEIVKVPRIEELEKLLKEDEASRIIEMGNEDTSTEVAMPMEEITSTETDMSMPAGADMENTGTGLTLDGRPIELLDDDDR